MHARALVAIVVSLVLAALGIRPALAVEQHAAVAVESESPGLASLTRRVAEMLSNVGI